MKKSTSFLNYFRPNLFVSNIHKINLNTLAMAKIKLVILDLDNTLVPHFTKKPTSYVRNFIKNIKSYNMKIVIASNNTKNRVYNFCADLEVDKIIHNANKPFLIKFKKIFKEFDVLPEETIVIGDQFVTDIWLANRLKIKSILVTTSFSIILDKDKNRQPSYFKYFIEKYIFNKLQHNNMINKSDFSSTIIGTNHDIL